MSVNIGPRIGIEGEKQYRDAIKGIIEQGKTLDTEMQAISKGFKEAGDSSTEYERKSTNLSKQIDNQEKLIAALKDMVAKSTKETGANSTETQKWQQQLNKAQGELAVMQKNLSGLDDDTEDFTDAEKDATKQTSIFGDALKANLVGEAIVAGLKAMADGVKKVASAMADAFKDSVAWADEIATLSVTTGISTETLQEWSYAAGLVDVDVSTLTGANKKLISTMSKAANGNKETAEAFKELGVEIMDSEGNMRASQDVMFELLDALGTIDNETERDAAAMEFFGKSAGDLNPIIEAGSETMKALADEAHNVGYVLDEDAIGALTRTQDAFDRITNATDALTRNMSAAFAPMVAELAETVLPEIQSFGLALADVFNGEMTVGQFVDMVVLKLNEFVTYIQENKDTFLEQGKELLTSLMQGMKVLLPEILKMAVTLILDFADSILSNIDEVVDTGVDIIVSLAEGLIEALPKLIEKAPEIIAKLVVAIIENLPELLEAGWKLIVALGEGLYNALPALGEAALDIWNAIDEVLQGFPSAALDWGKNLVKGMWEGISSSYTWIKNKIRGWVGDVVSFVKNLFGIHSPSTVFAGIGENLGLGLGLGFEDTMKDVARDMGKSIPMKFGGGSSRTTNLGGISIVVNGAEGQDVNQLADIVMMKMQNAVSRRESVFA